MTDRTLETKHDSPGSSIVQRKPAEHQHKHPALGCKCEKIMN